MPTARNGAVTFHVWYLTDVRILALMIAKITSQSHTSGRGMTELLQRCAQTAGPEEF
jgi:hypothetical protein